MRTEQLAELSEHVVKTAARLGASDASAICYGVKEDMVRFSNNSVTVAKSLTIMELQLYVAKARRRIVGSTSNPSLQAVKEFAEKLLKGCEQLPESPDYTPLPTGTRIKPVRKVAPTTPSRRLLEACQQAVDSAMSQGAKRVSGALTSRDVSLRIHTSAGASGLDVYSSAVLNVRAFAEGDASGHGLSCTPGLKLLQAEEAGRRAGEYAKSCQGARPCQEGVYDVVMSPTVAADLFQHVGSYASAFYVDAGISFLGGKLGNMVANSMLTLRDESLAEGGLNRRRFDDEGLLTKKTPIVAKGRLENYLHNSTTAKKARTNTTGNAGIIVPHPWNLVVEPGDRTLDELMEGVEKGILVTNNWYTRFQNTRTGEYSTLPRDAAFLIKRGKISHPITGIRISDSIPRQIEHVDAMSRERRWVQWWEVSIPTLTPWILLPSVSVTTAVG